MKYRVRPEFKKYALSFIPMNSVLLNFTNLLMPIVQQSNSPFESKLKIKKIDFTNFSAELIKPKGQKDVPCFLYLHGGGFVLKSSKAHKDLVREYAYKCNVAVLFVDYRLAPKYKYPIPMMDCYNAYLWALKYFKNNRIYIGGDSAGANLALAVTRKAIEEKKRIPDKMLLIYPVTDTRMITDSMKKYTDTPIWNSKLNHKIWNLYVGKEELHNRFVSPAEAKDYSLFPKCYIETAEFDCLRDEGIQLAKQMKKQGVSVELHNTRGTIHGYDVENQSDYIRMFISKRIDFLKSKLEK